MKQLLTLIAAKLPPNIIRDIIGRIGTSSPAFFKKIQAIAITFAGVFTAAWITLKTTPNLVPHQEIWTVVLEILVGFSAGSGASASITTTDPKYMSKEVKSVVIEEAVQKGETPDLH
jgi:hypothetical protein